MSDDEDLDVPEVADQQPAAAPAPAEHVQTIAVDAFARTPVAQKQHPAVLRSFVLIEKQKHGTRKLSAGAWEQLFNEFLTAERR